MRGWQSYSALAFAFLILGSESSYGDCLGRYNEYIDEARASGQKGAAITAAIGLGGGVITSVIEPEGAMLATPVVLVALGAATTQVEVEDRDLISARDVLVDLQLGDGLHLREFVVKAQKAGLSYGVETVKMHLTELNQKEVLCSNGRLLTASQIITWLKAQ